MPESALKQGSSHYAVYRASQEEAMVILSSLRRLLKARKQDLASQAADVFMECFETNVLGHADDEEAAVFAEVLSAHPYLNPVIPELRYEHEGMRALARTIRRRFSERRALDDDALALVTAVTFCSAYHQHHEQTALLTHLEVQPS